MILLVRHGQTEANAAGLLLGRADPGLTELGRAQAAAAAPALPADAVIYSSPLARARQTAEILAGGRPVVVDDAWVELDYGRYDGLAVAAVPAGEWERWRDDVHYRPPGGETLAECGFRVRAACDALIGEAAERDVIVVSHVSPIKAAVAWTLGVGDEASWRMFLAVGAICRVDVTPRGPSLRSYNEIHHLAALGFTGP